MTRNRPIPHISEADKAYIRSLLIHEDAHILAFNKPSGLPSQVRGNRARNLDHLLWAFAKSNGKRPRLVHRLDAGTSGVIVAGRTQPAAVALSEAFAGRTAEKTYLALVSGALREVEAGRIETSIARVPDDRGERLVVDHPEGKLATTDWRVLSQAGDMALMELKPQTGRMHQLRLHMAHLGLPILGDDRYGGALAGRLMLHAARLTLPHPGGDGPITLSAPLPEDFRNAARTRGLSLPIAEVGASD
ncbi:MAG: RluA family pseudouridine synthase [Hyphomonadaceae bacterium]|nr:RluA family pseudouridine synthase [Hyphomonadaceae bacterium]